MFETTFSKKRQVTPFFLLRIRVTALPLFQLFAAFKPSFGIYPEHRGHEKLRNVLMALVFWFGLSAVCVGMMMALPILVVLALGVNLVMFFSSSLSCACFPTDAQIQKLEEHLLMMHVQAPLQHIWSELHLQVKNSIIKCSAHCLSIRNTSQEPAPTILLLHGTGASATSFAKCFDRLSQNFHVLALDLPGFGRSQTEFDFTDAGRRHLQNMATDFWVEFIEAFLDARGLDTVILLATLTVALSALSSRA